MLRLLQLGTALLLATTLAPAYSAKPKDTKSHEDVEWMWQYTQDQTHPDGRENELVSDLRFWPMLDQYFTAPQTFWGPAIAGKYRSLPDTVLDHLTVPGKVIGEQNRYITVTGCTIHFCPARGLLWADLNGHHHLVAFAAIDWSKQGRPTSDPAAEYNLYLFADDPLTVEGPGAGSTANPAQHVPAALTKSIGRWAAQPLAGSGIVQNITHAFLVDPDGTPHEVPPASLGVRAPKQHSDEEESQPVLRPRD